MRGLFIFDLKRSFCGWISAIPQNRNCSDARPSRGSVLVEFTLIMPLLFLILGGVFDWGLYFYVQHVAQEAARVGARAAALSSNAAAVQELVSSRIPQDGIFSSFIHIDVLGPGNTGELNDASNQLMVKVKVSGTYNFASLRLFGFGSKPIVTESLMRFQGQPAIT